MEKLGTQWVITKSVRVLCAGMICAWLCGATSVSAAAATEPAPPGKMVDLGGHRLHVNCSGEGQPRLWWWRMGWEIFPLTGFWCRQKSRAFTRVCTYDRAGYAWSDAGPLPRTFAQINLELRDALTKLGERGPFVLVGHSYGGPLVRSFAAIYPRDVAGMVQVDAAFEGMRVGIGGKATLRLGTDAKGRSIPAPREEMKDVGQAFDESGGARAAGAFFGSDV